MMNARFETVRKLGLGTAFAGLLCAPLAVEAAIPDSFGYQGFLRDSGGAPVNVPVTMVFNLYDVASGGATLCTYTPAGSVPVTNGAFSVRLGDASAGTSSAACDTLEFDRPLYLGIAVNGGAEMSPRQPLDSAPYAFVSESGSAQATVNCGGGDTIADALDSLPAGSGDAVITITGVCAENVKITRGNVTLKGASGNPATDGITGVTPTPKPYTPVVEVNGARNVTIQDLTISGVTGGHAGVGVHNGASAELINTIVHNNDEEGVWVVKTSSLNLSAGSMIADNGKSGVVANRASQVTIDASTIVRNGGGDQNNPQGNGLVITEGSSGRLLNGSRVGGSAATGTPDSDQNAGDAVDVIRSSTFTMDGSEIHAGAGASGCGLWVSDGSSAHIKSNNTITSDLTVWNCSAVNSYRSSSVRLAGLNNVITMTQYVTQDLGATPPVANDTRSIYAIDTEMASSFRQNGSGPTGGSATITGRVESFNQSTVDLRSSTINGDVTADGEFTNVRLSTRSGAPSGFTTTVNGKVQVSGNSRADLNAGFGTPLVNGDIDCGFVSRRTDPSSRINSNFNNFGAGFGFTNCGLVDLSTLIMSQPISLTNGVPATYVFTVTHSDPRFKDASGNAKLIINFATTGSPTPGVNITTLTISGPGGGFCDTTGVPFVGFGCDLGNLQPGETATVTAEFTPTGSGTLQISASSQAGRFNVDNNFANNDVSSNALTIDPPP